MLFRAHEGDRKRILRASVVFLWPALRPSSAAFRSRVRGAFHQITDIDARTKNEEINGWARGIS